MSPDNEQPEAIKPRPDYPPKTPPPPKRPPSPPPPDPPRSEHAHLLDGLPVPQRAGSRPGGPRSTVLMKNRQGASWTLENAPWAPKKAAGNVDARLKRWGMQPPERLPGVVVALVTAVLVDGGRRISVHLSEQQGQVLVLALSHQAASDDDGEELLNAVRERGVTSCGTETTADGRQVWALLDLTPALT